MAFNNLGRELYERTLDMAGKSILLKKKKDAVRLLKESPDDFLDKLSATAYRCGRPHKFEALKQALHWVGDYNTVTHYFVDIGKTTLKEYNDSVQGFSSQQFFDLGDEYTVEINFEFGTVLLNFTSFSEDTSLSINGHKILGSFDLFASIDREVTNGFTAPITTPITTAYLGEDNRLLLAYVPGGLLSLGTKHKTVDAVYNDHPCKIELIRGKADDIHVALLSAALMSVIHVLAVKNTVQIRNNKKSQHPTKTTNTPHVKHDHVHIIYDDKVVPLQRYISEHPSEYVYKGGHHASPVPHVRRGFYRKSRGRGDYDLVNGEYIYVGDKQGKYSYVSATHVGTKNDTVIIYKA